MAGAVDAAVTVGPEDPETRKRVSAEGAATGAKEPMARSGGPAVGGVGVVTAVVSRAVRSRTGNRAGAGDLRASRMGIRPCLLPPVRVPAIQAARTTGLRPGMKSLRKRAAMVPGRVGGEGEVAAGAASLAGDRPAMGADRHRPPATSGFRSRLHFFMQSPCCSG